MREHPIEYTRAERLGLAAVALVGLAGVNGLFYYGLLSRPGALADALANPISAAVVAESLVLVGVFAYLLRRWGVSRLGWGWFVVLCVLGTMAFAVPVAVLLFPTRRTGGTAAAGPSVDPRAASAGPDAGVRRE